MKREKTLLMSTA